MNLPAFEKRKKYMAYASLHGHGPYGKKPTKKDTVRTVRFTSRPLTNRIRGLYCNLRTEYFPFLFMAQARSTQPKDQREKNEGP